MADIIIRALPLRRPLRASLTHDDALQIQVVDDVQGAEDRKIPISIICVISGRITIVHQFVAIAAENHARINLTIPAAHKNKSLRSPQISGYFRAVPSRQEGRIAIVTNARRDVVDAAASGARSCSQGGFFRERALAAQDVRR